MVLAHAVQLIGVVSHNPKILIRFQVRTHTWMRVPSSAWVLVVPSARTKGRQPFDASLSHLCFSPFFPLYKWLKNVVLWGLKENDVMTFKVLTALPWLMWLSGLGAGLKTERSPVWFPVRAHAWVLGQVPTWGCERGNWLVNLFHRDFLSLFPPSLPISLKINK